MLLRVKTVISVKPVNSLAGYLMLQKLHSTSFSHFFLFSSEYKQGTKQCMVDYTIKHIANTHSKTSKILKIIQRTRIFPANGL